MIDLATFASLAKEHGLFVALVVYVIWDSRQRESRYVSIIDKLSKSYDKIAKDVESIKVNILGK